MAIGSGLGECNSLGRAVRLELDRDGKDTDRDEQCTVIERSQDLLARLAVAEPTFTHQAA